MLFGRLFFWRRKVEVTSQEDLEPILLDPSVFSPDMDTKILRKLLDITSFMFQELS